MKGKRVLVRSGPDGPLVPLATFRLVGDRVVADWHNDHYREEIESLGHRALVAGVPRALRPSDGAMFFDHLEAIYAHSSLIVVETVG